MEDDKIPIPCGPKFSLQPRSKFRVLRSKDDIKEDIKMSEWVKFS